MEQPSPFASRVRDTVGAAGSVLLLGNKINAAEIVDQSAYELLPTETVCFDDLLLGVASRQVEWSHTDCVSSSIHSAL